MSGKNPSLFLGSQFLSFIAHKTASRVPIRPTKPSGAHTQRAIFFVPSTGRQAQSLVVDSTRGCLFFALLFPRSRMLLFSFSARRHSSLPLPPLSLSLFLFLSLVFPSIPSHVAKIEEIHARRCILEQFPENISTSRFSSRPSRPSSGGRAEVERGVGNLRATDFAPRLPHGPTEVEDRSSVWCGS